jgi:hypothetical protein
VRSNTVAETHIGARGGLVNVPPSGGDEPDGENAGGGGIESQARNSPSASARVDPHAAVGRQENVGCFRISDHCRERAESRPRVGRNVPFDGWLPPLLSPGRAGSGSSSSSGSSSGSGSGSGFSFAAKIAGELSVGRGSRQGAIFVSTVTRRTS